MRTRSDRWPVVGTVGAGRRQPRRALLFWNAESPHEFLSVGRPIAVQHSAFAFDCRRLAAGGISSGGVGRRYLRRGSIAISIKKRRSSHDTLSSSS